MAGVTVLGAVSAALAFHARAVTTPSAPTAQQQSDPLSLGDDIAPLTRTCARSHDHRTPTRSADCVAWATSGPINVVIVGSDRIDPLQWLGSYTQPRWQKAHGEWLVAQARTVTDAKGQCRDGWHDSSQQAELRLGPTTRRHIKLITLRCDPAAKSWMVVGDAHTDVWSRACGGDHMVDLDRARDAFVNSLVVGGAHVRIHYRQEYAPGSLYPGGCRSSVPSDGRVAYIDVTAR